MTQKARLLQMFHSKSVWSNYELRSMDVPMFQYPARILELNEDLRLKGFEIIGYFDKQDQKKYYYELREMKRVQKDLFQDVA